MMETSLSVDEILAPWAPGKVQEAYGKAWNRFMAFLTTGDANKDGGR